jgi:RNA polymerase sigma-70 factor, ECF subfamily
VTDVSNLLERATHGDATKNPELFAALHAELHTLARSAMRSERKDHTLQPTALVNEAFLRLVKAPVSWESRAQFFSASARVMRRILIEHARANHATKRRGDRHKVQFHEPMALVESDPEQLLSIDSALEKLAEIDPRATHVVELRFFVGMSVEETAKILALSEKTVTRDWEFARVWLERELRTLRPE